MTYKYPRVETIKRYYEDGYYSLEQMKFFTDNGALTKEEFEEMTGKEYPEDTQA